MRAEAILPAAFAAGSARTGVHTEQLMAKTLEQIQQQIEKLERQAEAIKNKEAAEVVKRIRIAIAHYDLTAEDLFGTQAGKVAPLKRAKADGKKDAGMKATTVKASRKGIPVAIKYRDGAGNTWTGRGSKPRWLVAAIEGGKKVEDFAI